MTRQPPAMHHKAAEAVKVRGGYTLIELLIAAVLTATLMTVVWGLLSMYNGWLTAGRVQSEERQLRRSLRALLQDDLEAVALQDGSREVQFLESAAEPVSTGQEAMLQDSGEDPLAAAMEPGLESENLSTWLQSLQLPGDMRGLPPVSVFGTSTMLRLVVPARLESVEADSGKLTGVAEFETSPMAESSIATPPSSSAGRPAPMRIVIWQFRPWGGTLTGAADASGGTPDVGVAEPPLSLPGPGLTRQEWDGTTLLQLHREQGLNSGGAMPETDLETAANAASGAAAFPAPAPLWEERIPEALAVEFEYFDGRVWQASWNSAAQAGLPVAVRLRMWMVAVAAAEELTRRAESAVVPRELPATADAAAGEFSNAVPPDAAVPMQLVETLLLLQPIFGAMPGLTDSEEVLPGGVP